MNTNISVADRPVTQQGMMGMKLGAQGPGRQIADKSYYMGQLRMKCDEMQEEMNRMNQEAEQFTKDTAKYSQMERKYESLIKEVRKLQGDLADYNLIVDKSRNNTDPADIAHVYNMLKNKNDSERGKIDEIFTERQEKEAEIKNLEAEAARFQKAAEEKLKSLSNEQRLAYAQLQDDHSRLMADVEQKQAHYDQLCRQVAAGEQSLKSEPLKQRLNVLEEQQLKLEERKAELELEVNKPVLSEAEQREQLLDQVKQDNKDIAIYERNIQEVEKRIRDANDEIEQLESGNSVSDDVKKHQKLQEKDQEMTEFIDNFEETFKRESAAVKDAEFRIMKLLEHISKDLGRQTQLPNKEGFEELQSEVAQKERGLENAQTTAERLQQEQKMRDMELEKINNLDSKISIELNTLNERREQMKTELTTFGDIGKLKTDADTFRHDMQTRRKQLDARRKALKQQVQHISLQYDKEKKTLAASESAGTLEALEQKLRHYEQNIFHLNEFIDSKEAETDYSGVYEEVSKQVADVNELLKTINSRPYG